MSEKTDNNLINGSRQSSSSNESSSEKLKARIVELEKQVEDLKKELVAQRQSMETALEEAKETSHAKTRFLFNMSHDIRTPMNAIKGFTGMAKKYSTDVTKVESYLDRIDISSTQLLSLINQVLEMSRIESGKIELENKPMNMNDNFTSMTTVLKAQAATKNLTFKPRIRDIKNNYVLADETRMGQIALNIAGNAIKYTPEGGTIKYTLKEVVCPIEGHARFVLTVEDDGIGMSADYLKVLFEPFSRETTTATSKIQGTGLGMSIVKQLVDLLKGTIEVKSELGKGTRFDVTMDLEIAEKFRKTKGKARAVDPSEFEGKRVLLVEDNEMNREIARDILEENGLVVEEAEDGDIAVSILRTAAQVNNLNFYDFILMDIQMPRMNGYEATKEIRQIEAAYDSHIPIIAMTANAFSEDRQNAIDAGMDAHLSKPVEIAKLWKTLAEFI